MWKKTRRYRTLTAAPVRHRGGGGQTFFGSEHILSAVTRGTSQIRKLTHRCEETMQEYDATVYYCLQRCVRKLRNCRRTHSCKQKITAMGKIHICEGILLRNTAVKKCEKLRLRRFGPSDVRELLFAMLSYSLEVCCIT